MGALRYHVRPELRNPSLLVALEGWNDAGESASTAARYVADQIRSVPLAEIDPEEFYDFTVRRPEVAVRDGVVGDLRWPALELRFGASDPETDLVVLLGAEPHLRWRRFADEIEDLVDALGIRRVGLLGAYLADVLYSRPVEVTSVASDPSLLGTHALEPVHYEGPTGMVGVLTHRLTRRGCDVASFWAGLPHYVNVSPNPRGALALLEELSEFLRLRLDLAPLRRDAADCEDRVSALVSADPELSEYVRQLKRREFAQ